MSEPDEQPEADSPVKELTSKYTHLSETDRFWLVAMKAEGLSQTEMARRIGCSQSTVSDFFKRAGLNAETIRQVARSYAPEAVRQARRAMAPAAKRGDSTPALKMLALGHAELGAPSANSAGGGGITINIGAPGQPLQLPTVTIESTPLSPPFSSSHGESPQNQAINTQGRIMPLLDTKAITPASPSKDEA